MKHFPTYSAISLQQNKTLCKQRENSKKIVKMDDHEEMSDLYDKDKQLIYNVGTKSAFPIELLEKDFCEYFCEYFLRFFRLRFLQLFVVI